MKKTILMSFFLVGNISYSADVSIPTNDITCPEGTKEVISCKHDMSKLDRDKLFHLRKHGGFGIVKLLKICKLDTKDNNTHTYEMILVRDHTYNSQRLQTRGWLRNGRWSFSYAGSVSGVVSFDPEIETSSEGKKQLNVAESDGGSGPRVLLDCQ